MPNIETSHRENSGNQFENIFAAAVAISTFTIPVVRCQKYIIVFVLPQNINEWKRRSLIGLFKEVQRASCTIGIIDKDVREAVIYVLADFVR